MRSPACTCGTSDGSHAAFSRQSADPSKQPQAIAAIDVPRACHRRSEGNHRRERNWWPGKKVLLAPKWIEDISWGESKVFVNLSRDNIRRSPEYTDTSVLTRDYEARMHRHYDRKGYWMDDQVRKSVADTTVAHAK